MSIVKEGYPFILPPLALGLALVIVSRMGLLTTGPLHFPAAVASVIPGLGAILLVFALFCVFFFRDPRITISTGEKNLLSPCNGTVLEIVEDENERIIRVFLSVFNVHLQRSPVKGRVTEVEHRNGQFLAAWNPEAHSLNEQNIITIQGADGRVYVVRQIAGFLARRCVSWVSQGDTLEAGDKIGMIKFSSQVDLHLPKTVSITVKKADKVRAGMSIMGTL